jgi:acetoin utilization deacetylase AcuC-like enzyme
LERVAIIDFDVHHGNGTQAILDDDPSVMFISSHQYPFYPGTGSINDIGTGEGSGTKVNLPLMAKTDDEGFERLYSEIVIPLLRRFQPELILVSVGFDAHWKDPLANIDLSLAGYNRLTENLIALADELCQGRIVFTLEGGYDVEVLAPGVGNVFRALMKDDNYDDELGQSFWAGIDVSGLIYQLKQIHHL